MTDIEGSTRLFRDLGDDYVALLEVHNALLRQAFGQHGGAEVATEGDALVVAFGDAAEALAGCVDGQLALGSHRWPEGAEIRVRMGLHTAQATPTGDNYVSLGLHQAARICAGAHGGQIVLSEATASEVRGRLPGGVSLLPLGSFQLRGFGAPARLFQVRHPRLAAEFPPLRVQGVVHHNLPFHRSGFVGRTAERAALADAIRTTGVVTIVGVGGVGKTRLAVQVALDVLDDFEDGAWLVELASTFDRTGIASAMAGVLRLAEVQGRSLEDVVLDHLSARAALIVLDNCEQVLGPAAEFAEVLTRRCPQVVVVATSREPLAIEGEVVWRLEPLPVPAPDRVRSAADVAGDDAVRLFEARAALARPGFRVSDDTAADVARIVRQVDGIPLAIELAAAALSDRALAGVVDGLSDRFSLLTYGRRTAPERHQTLRAALEWSLDLLGAEERLLFGRLATFARTGTIEAAREVCGVEPLAERSVPTLLRRLIRASLVSAGDDLERWTMLGSVHELALLELARIGEADVLADRHREWFARRAEALGPLIGLRGRGDVVALLSADLDNVRLALTSATAEGDGDRALRTAASMAPFWISHGDWSAGIGHLRDALALPEGSEVHPAVRGRALAALGSLLLLRGDTTEAETAFTHASAIATGSGDEVTLARAASGLGYAAFRRSQLRAATEAWQQALTHAERAGDERVAAGILRSLAIAAGSRGDQAAAGALLDRAIASAEHAQDDQLLRLLLGARAETELWLGGYEQARDLYAQALELASTIGDLSARPLLVCELGWVALLSGDVAAAERLAAEAVELAEDVGNRRVLASSLRLRGDARVRRGDFTGAASDLAHALEVAEELGAPAEIAGVLCSQAVAALEQGRTDEARRLAAAAEDRTHLPHAMRAEFPPWVLGMAALADGDLRVAEDGFRVGLDESATAAAPRHQANSRWGLAMVRAATGRLAEAARWHREALVLRDRIGDSLGVADSLVGAAAIVGPTDGATARALLRAAESLRSTATAVPTPRQAAEVAAVLERLNDRGGTEGTTQPPAEASIVARAVQALETLERVQGALTD